jgi:hypothetical protein
MARKGRTLGAFCVSFIVNGRITKDKKLKSNRLCHGAFACIGVIPDLSLSAQKKEFWGISFSL